MGKISEKIKAFWKRLGEEDVIDAEYVDLPDGLKKPISAEKILATEGATSGGMNQYIVDKKPVAPNKGKGSSNRTRNVGVREHD